MIWDENTPISVDNLNDLEGRIAQALSNVNDAKVLIAAAIQAMGQSASGSDTFGQLAAKIQNISKDADAATGEVLAGKTFYQGGVKRTGTMPDRGTVNQTLTTQGQEYTIPAGRHSGSGKVKAQFANLVAANVLNGVNIGGVTGTARRVAHGLATADSSGIITVTGIPWITMNCTVVVRGAPLVSGFFRYRQIVYRSGNATMQYRMIQGTRHVEEPGDGGSFTLVKLSSPITVNPGVGFTCPGFESGLSYSYVVTED